MPTVVVENDWRTLTRPIENTKRPNRFLHDFLFPSSVVETLPTETVDWGSFEGGREIAPFIRKNGEAALVGGYTTKEHTVAPPNIRIKRPLTASDLLFKREPGDVVYANSGSPANSAARKIARNLQRMDDMIVNTEEYLVSMALQGVISYEVADQEVITITFPRPSANNITLSTFWDDATPANTDVSANIVSVKKVFSDATGLAVTDCILGSEAADSFRDLATGGFIKTLNNQQNVLGGQVDLTQQYDRDGVIYLGIVDGVRFWEYPRTATLPDGTSVDLIRPKYAEFVNRNAQASERAMYYGAIADMKTLQGRRYQGRRFVKSWEQEDPSVRYYLAQSRPLPVHRRADDTVSMKVISG